jgi:tetratricopeptide (TPR) repeat protein
MTSYKQPSTIGQVLQFKPVINDWALKAQENYQTNNPDTARYWAEKTTELDQGNITAWNVLGRIALDENALPQAEHLFKQALAAAPKNEETLINLGYSYLAQQEYASAERCFLRALAQSETGEKARISLAYSAMLQGQIEIAFSSYRKLFRDGIDNIHVINALIDCSEQFVADRYLPELAQDITELLRYENIDHQRLAPLALSLLTHRFQLYDNDSEISFDDICQDSLLITALQHCSLRSPQFETFIKSVREALLRVCIESGTLSDDCIPLVIAMGVHQAYSGYIASYTSDEEQLLINLEDSITDQLKQKSSEPNDIVGALLITAMYKNLYQCDYSYNLASYDLEDWPAGARAVMDLAFYQPQQHAIFLHTVNEHFADLETETIALSTPYWESLNRQYSEIPPDPFYKELKAADGEKPQLLLLSCDAGQRGLKIAADYPDIEILVFEPNRSSVAYALMQAANLQISNIEFRCGDLETVLDNQKFALIECAGWFDYIDDDDLLMNQLVNHLTEDGVIRLGLEDASAQKELLDIQTFIANRKIPAGNTELIMIRDTLQAQTDSKWQNILQAPWFYQADEAYNRLFFQRRFANIDDISRICAEHNLCVHHDSLKNRQEYNKRFGNVFNQLDGYLLISR